MGGMIIGRGADNNLILGYENISRYHAQITSDGQRYYVTDLNSGNGTYLGNAKLTPNEPTAWTAGTPLRIGEVLIHLKQIQEPTVAPDDQETRVGWVPEAPAQARTKSRMPIVILLLLVLLCACLALGAVTYYYL